MGVVFLCLPNEMIHVSTVINASSLERFLIISLPYLLSMTFLHKDFLSKAYFQSHLCSRAPLKQSILSSTYAPLLCWLTHCGPINWVEFVFSIKTPQNLYSLLAILTGSGKTDRETENK